jgi:hypothetical protein
MDIQEVNINYKLKSEFGNYFVLKRFPDEEFLAIPNDPVAKAGIGKAVYPYPRVISVQCNYLLEIVDHTSIFCRVVDDEVWGKIVKDDTSYLDDGPPMPTMVSDPETGEYVPLLTPRRIGNQLAHC